jgi:hypothetical protein
MKRDTPILGFIIGLLLPLLGMFIVYAFWGHHQGLGSFLSSLTRQKGMAAKVLLLSVLPNMIPFAYTNIKRMDYAMRGIFIATMLYAVAIIIIMFVW